MIYILRPDFLLTFLFSSCTIKYILLTFFVFISHFSFPGENKIDSLLRVLKTAREDTGKVKIFNQLSDICPENEMLGYSEQAFLLAQKLNYKKGLADALNNIGYVYQFLKGQMDKALGYHLKALKIRQDLNDKLGIAASLNNIGLIYRNSGQNLKALDYYRQSLVLREEMNDKPSMANSYNNLGTLYTLMNNIDSGLYYQLKSISIGEELGLRSQLSASYHTIATTYFRTKNFDKAFEYDMKTLKLWEEIGNKSGISNSLTNIARVYIEKKDYRKALDYAGRSWKIANELGSPFNKQVAAETLSELFALAKDYKNAYEFHQKFSDMKDTLLNMESSRQIAEMETRYETERKDKEIKLLNKDKELAASESKKQRLLLWSVAGGFCLVVFFAVIMVQRFRIIQRQKQIIEKQKALVDEKNKLVEQQKNHIEEKHKETTDSITYAKRLQQAILPPAELIKKHFQNSFVLYKPKDIVAGDFYWMEVIGDFGYPSTLLRASAQSPVAERSRSHIIFIAAADCTGHGVPGAMVSVVCSNALNRAVKEFGLRDTGKILDKVTDLVLETFEKSASEVKDGMDISLLAYNTTSKQIQWSGANNPLWYIQNGQINEIKADKQPVGKFDIRKPFTTHNIKLPSSDSCLPTTFYLFTDGLPDQFGGPKGKKFMYKRFENNLSDICKLPMDEQHTYLEKAFQDWKGTLEQVDDVTVIGIKI